MLNFKVPARPPLTLASSRFLPRGRRGVFPPCRANPRHVSPGRPYNPLQHPPNTSRHPRLPVELDIFVIVATGNHNLSFLLDPDLGYLMPPLQKRKSNGTPPTTYTSLHHPFGQRLGVNTKRLLNDPSLCTIRVSFRSRFAAPSTRAPQLSRPYAYLR